MSEPYYETTVFNENASLSTDTSMNTAFEENVSLSTDISVNIMIVLPFDALQLYCFVVSCLTKRLYFIIL